MDSKLIFSRMEESTVALMDLWMKYSGINGLVDEVQLH
jgi:hypothetical protein